MSIKHALKMAALHFGLEVKRYNSAESAEARLFALLSYQRIDTIVDVGANDGGYGKLLRRGGYAGTIVSFEPLEREREALIAAASADDKWFVAPRMALGADDTEVDIHVAGNSASSSILPMNRAHEDAAPESKYVGAQRVQVRRLDGIEHPALASASRLMLKIDTQGYEMAVLQGAEKLLPDICGVQLELSLTNLYDGQTLYLDLIQWLQERGFDLWNVIPGFVNPATGRILQFDGVFFRDSKEMTPSRGAFLGGDRSDTPTGTRTSGHQ